MTNQHLIMPITRQQILQIFSGPWLPMMTSAAILVLFVWWFFVTALPVFEREEMPTAPNVIAPVVKTPTKLSLKNLDIFGSAQTGLTVDATSAAKPTKLNLTLRGILATEDPSQGIAQIQNAQQEEKDFVVSDSVFGMATLEAIHIDRVTLLHNGKFETLLLPEEFLNVKHFSAERHQIERKKIASNYRDIFLSRNGMELIKLFGFDTAWKNGGFVGFIIKALGDKGREMMETLEIEDGDLITVVNGKRFSESLDATQSLTELKTATSFDVIIERGGVEIPMHFDLDAPVDEYANLPEGKTKADVISEKALTAPVWEEKAKAEEYRAKQLERRTGVPEEVEYDH